MKTLLLVCALAACRSPASRPPVPPELDAIIEKTVHDSHLLGLAAMVVDHGHVVLEKGYGFTDLDRKTPITADTVFEIGSLSKQFTAAAILRLVDQGTLKLSDPVSAYLPEMSKDLTIEQLMRQISGLAEYAHLENVGKPPAELVHIIATMPPVFPPGTRWMYSNSNYFLLGQIVEVVAKRPFGDFLHDEVLARAGATSIRICAPDTAQAHPSDVSWDQTAAGSAFDVRNYGGAGELCASAHDLLHWQDALFAGKVLSPASLAVMTTPGTLLDGSPENYAGGLIADHVLGHPRIWHNGGVPGGYEGELAWYPDDRLQVVLLTNTLNNPPAITLGTLDRALTVEHLHLTMPKAQDLALGSDALAPYVGRYAGGGLVAEVTVAGSHLHVRVAGGVDDDLHFQGNDRFVLAKNPGVEYRFAGARLDVFREGDKIATLQR